MPARPPAKPARHSPEAKLMADGQSEAAWGTYGRSHIKLMRALNNAADESPRLALRVKIDEKKSHHTV